MKKIAVGDLGEFWYGDYKEPFEQLEGGVPGHPVGVVLKDDAGKIMCAYCGKTYHSLGPHLNATHRTTAREYKENVGLLFKSALVSERTRFKFVRRARSSSPNSAQRMAQIGALASHRTAGQSQNTPERLNKTGRCYLQVLTVARQIARDRQRVTINRLAERGIGLKTIRRYFGSLEKLREIVDQPARFKWQNRWTDAALLGALKNVAAELGRTPGLSDLARFGLPSKRPFVDRWGSWGNACRAAGLIPNLPLPRDDEFDLAVLSGYAATGNFHLVAENVSSRTAAVASVFAKYGCPYPSHRGATQLRREWAADMARRLAGVDAAA